MSREFCVRRAQFAACLCRVRSQNCNHGGQPCGNISVCVREQRFQFSVMEVLRVLLSGTVRILERYDVRFCMAVFPQLLLQHRHYLVPSEFMGALVL